MSLHGLALFCLVYVIATATPGPGIAAVVARALSRGTYGLPAFIAGFVVGDLIWFTFAATGMAALARAAHGGFMVVKYFGVLYLLYLSYRMWTAPARPLADKAVIDKTPDFVKSIPAWKALEDTTIVAYEMNGAPLPHLNGFPARLVLPGWTGTYWMKHLVSINALTKPLGTFWMASAYRVPLGKFPMVARFISQETPVNTPITEIIVNSLITSHADGANLTAGAEVGGIAWDGGYGISSVEVSTDGAKSWVPAKLGENLGPFAFRAFSHPLTTKGKHTVMARATNKIGQTQTTELNHNPPGYHHNVVHSITLNVA